MLRHCHRVLDNDLCHNGCRCRSSAPPMLESLCLRLEAAGGHGCGLLHLVDRSVSTSTPTPSHVFATFLANETSGVSTLCGLTIVEIDEDVGDDGWEEVENKCSCDLGPRVMGPRTHTLGLSLFPREVLNSRRPGARAVGALLIPFACNGQRDAFRDNVFGQEKVGHALDNAS